MDVESEIDAAELELLLQEETQLQEDTSVHVGAPGSAGPMHRERM